MAERRSWVPTVARTRPLQKSGGKGGAPRRLSTHSLTEFKDVALRHAADLTRATDAIHFRICTAADDRNGDPLWSFDILDKGAMTLDALCAEIGASPRGLRMVLNALVGLDVLSKDAARRYALTEESATFLVTGKSAYHGAFFLLTKEPMLSSWGSSMRWLGAGGQRTTSIENKKGQASFCGS